jgi:hypothetical protein
VSPQITTIKRIHWKVRKPYPKEYEETAKEEPKKLCTREIIKEKGKG